MHTTAIIEHVATAAKAAREAAAVAAMAVSVSSSRLATGESPMDELVGLRETLETSQPTSPQSPAGTPDPVTEGYLAAEILGAGELVDCCPTCLAYDGELLPGDPDPSELETCPTCGVASVEWTLVMQIGDAITSLVNGNDEEAA